MAGIGYWGQDPQTEPLYTQEELEELKEIEADNKNTEEKIIKNPKNED
jgi:hypothetical protein